MTIDTFVDSKDVTLPIDDWTQIADQDNLRSRIKVVNLDASDNAFLMMPKDQYPFALDYAGTSVGSTTIPNPRDLFVDKGVWAIRFKINSGAPASLQVPFYIGADPLSANFSAWEWSGTDLLVKFELQTPAGRMQPVFPGVNPVDEWHTYVAAQDGNKVKMFLDGAAFPLIPDGNGDSDFDIWLEGYPDNFNSIFLGAAPGPLASFDGQIDFIRVWSGFPATTDNLFLDYNFKEGTGTVVADDANGLDITHTLGGGSGWVGKDDGALILPLGTQEFKGRDAKQKLWMRSPAAITVNVTEFRHKE